MPRRDPDGTWNWGPLEGTGRGLMAGVRDGLGRAFGSIGPNDASTLGGRFGNIIANEINPLTGAATLGAMADARNAAIAGNSRGPTAPNTGADPRITSTRPVGSVVARGRADQSGLGPTRVSTGAGMSRGDGRFAGAGLLRGNTFGPSTPARNPNFQMPGTGGRAGPMPVDEYRATMPQLVRPEGGGGVDRGQSRLGAGQLGRGGDEALNAGSRAIYSRRGTQAEM